MSKTGGGIVVPFPGARASLWAVQGGLMFGSARTQRLAARIVEELDRAEEELEAVERELAIPPPATV